MADAKRDQWSSRDPAQGLGAAVTRRMEALGMNYDQLALATRIVGRSKLQRIAAGERLRWLHPEELEAIAEALGTTGRELLREAGYNVDAA